MSDKKIDNFNNIKTKKHSGKLRFFTKLFLSFLLLTTLVLVFIFNTNTNRRPLMLFNHTAFTILSTSMEDVYPKNSLILVKQINPESIALGDDITFFIDERTTVTHRVIAIQENFNKKDQRLFQTQGLNNAYPDRDFVSADSIVGKVVYCSIPLGIIISFFKTKLFILGSLITFLVFFIKALMISVLNNKKQLYKT